VRGRTLWPWVGSQITAAPRKSALLAVLFVVLGLLVTWQWRRGPARSEAVPAGEPERPDPAMPIDRIPAALDQPQRAAELSRDAARDPFSVDWSLFAAARSRETAEGVAGEADDAATPYAWSLELTLTTPDGADGATAVINGRLVRVGDSIEGATVESIAAQQVVLSTPQWGQMVLRMD
jgi:hypothetical protein